ncbi:MAG: hypothetical protein AB3N23_13705 [Paracoccaceae bacterium]
MPQCPDPSTTLAAAFNVKIGRLRMLRTSNPNFDELCRDYLEIHGHLTRGDQVNAPDHARYLLDLAESLTGLRAEIEDMLRSTELKDLPPTEKDKT